MDSDLTNSRKKIYSQGETIVHVCIETVRSPKTIIVLIDTCTIFDLESIFFMELVKSESMRIQFNLYIPG